MIRELLVTHAAAKAARAQRYLDEYTEQVKSGQALSNAAEASWGEYYKNSILIGGDEQRAPIGISYKATFVYKYVTTFVHGAPLSSASDGLPKE